MAGAYYFLVNVPTECLTVLRQQPAFSLQRGFQPLPF